MPAAASASQHQSMAVGGPTGASHDRQSCCFICIGASGTEEMPVIHRGKSNLVGYRKAAYRHSTRPFACGTPCNRRYHYRGLQSLYKSHCNEPYNVGDQIDRLEEPEIWPCSQYALPDLSGASPSAKPPDPLPAICEARKIMR